ncbi:COME operon protein 3 [Bacillus thuringiensis serovar israelensis ATCC 35646]|nr:COME operon protein 3 [Bacillus thuringiensis serovar israelensis ATCC 35646]
MLSFFCISIIYSAILNEKRRRVMRGMRIILLLVSVLICFSLNSASAKRYMMSIHTTSPLHMHRQHLSKMKVSFLKVGQG